MKKIYSIIRSATNNGVGLHISNQSYTDFASA